MKAVKFYVSAAIAGLCLLFSVLLLLLGQSSARLQNTLNQQQEEINRGSMSQQVGVNLLRDMGQVALNNPRMREVLAKNGYTIAPAPQPQPVPAPVAPVETTPTEPAPKSPTPKAKE